MGQSTSYVFPTSFEGLKEDELKAKLISIFLKHSLPEHAGLDEITHLKLLKKIIGSQLCDACTDDDTSAKCIELSHDFWACSAVIRQLEPNLSGDLRIQEDVKCNIIFPQSFRDARSSLTNYPMALHHV